MGSKNKAKMELKWRAQAVAPLSDLFIGTDFWLQFQ
jgi:hypothetical protein